MNRSVSLCLAAALSILLVRPLAAADQPQWGQRDTRNMISAEKGLPEGFQPGKRNAAGGVDLPSGSGVKWVARLGNNSYGSPVVAGGRVLVGTNNDAPRDPRVSGDRGVLMCFDERTGEFQWQLCLPKLTKIKWSDWYSIGLSSPPVVEGDRAYVVSNRGEVMCLDLRGMADGNQGPFTDEGRLMVEEGQPPLEPGPKDADVLWLFDIPGQLKVTPHNASSTSILVRGDLLYVSTSQGVEWTHRFVPHPEAPSLVVINKHTGRLVARDDFRIGPDITHGQWSSPAMGQVGGRAMMCFCGGNGVMYGFEPLEMDAKGDSPIFVERKSGQSPVERKSGQSPVDKPILLKNLWRFHGHPAAQKGDPPPPDHQHDSTSYQVTAMPVFLKDRVYVPFTQEAYHKMKLGRIACVDVTGSGDITRRGLVWAYDTIGASVSTVAVADGLVYAAGFDGRLHCLDAESGRCYWVHDTGGEVWGSPLVADGKVYLGCGGRAALWVLAAGRELKVIQRVRTLEGVFTTPTAANGVLWVATNRYLYAVGK